MRSLNDYFVPLGSLDINAGTNSLIGIVPDGGQFIGVAFNTTEAIDAASTGDILIDGAVTAPTTLVDFAITLVDIGGFAFVDSELFLPDNSSIQLTGGGEGTTGIADCVAIIRR